MDKDKLQVLKQFKNTIKNPSLSQDLFKDLNIENLDKMYQRALKELSEERKSNGEFYTYLSRRVSEIESAIEARVAFLTRLAEGLIPDEHTVLQQGDLIHVMVSDTDVVRTEEILASSPEGER